MKPLILSLLLTPLLQATPITGDYIFGGSFTLDSTKLTTATEIYPLTTSLLFSDGNVIPASLGQWEDTITLEYSPNVYVAGAFTFALTSLTVDFRNELFINVTGTGVISYVGFDPTEAWLSGTFTHHPKTTFGSGTFQITPKMELIPCPDVPEGGSTVAMLGGALLLVGLGRRREGRGL